MGSVIYYHKKTWRSWCPIYLHCLTIQSKEKGPSHIRRFRIYTPQQTLRRMSQLLIPIHSKKKTKFSRKTATESHEKCVLTCSFSLNPEFSQKIDNPPALIIIFPIEEYIYTPSVSEYIFKRISHAETFSTGMNDYKYKPVPSVGYKVERDLLSESFINVFLHHKTPCHARLNLNVVNPEKPRLILE